MKPEPGNTNPDRKVRLAGDTALVTGRAAIDRLDKNAEGLEIHRVAVDAAAHQLTMSVSAGRRG